MIGNNLHFYELFLSFVYNVFICFNIIQTHRFCQLYCCITASNDGRQHWSLICGSYIEPFEFVALMWLHIWLYTSDRIYFVEEKKKQIYFHCFHNFPLFTINFIDSSFVVFGFGNYILEILYFIVFFFCFFFFVCLILFLHGYETFNSRLI